ncbi:unnamed protein product [Thlaspi arvense]|uniref:Bet v I/Major latex protein domain-containing protein n=1 Tax=Thlaspi arvense TaxID=13288 RepID=A0AAU9SMH3_THLAR|nr:unnamed protein product [Thlaspi arvense]
MLGLKTPPGTEDLLLSSTSSTSNSLFPLYLKISLPQVQKSSTLTPKLLFFSLHAQGPLAFGPKVILVWFKLETDVDIRASPGKFHHIFAGRPHHVSKATPDGEAKVAKERIEAEEPEKNLITFRVIEGDLLKEYKSFVITIQANFKQGGPGSTVHWHVEYEKVDEKVAHPKSFLEFCVQRSMNIY